MTPEGKAASSKNALTHGALAVVHRPDEEPDDLVVSMAHGLAERLQPETAAELALVHGLSTDLVRLDRARRAAAAATDRARLEITRRPEDNERLLAAARHVPLWEEIRMVARLVLTSLGQRTERIEGMNTLKDLREMALAAFRELGNLDTSVEGAERLVELVSRLEVRTTLPEVRSSLLVEMADEALKYMNSLRAQITTREEARFAAEHELAALPDEKTTRKLDRYATALERSAMRRLQIFKELKGLAPPGDASSGSFGPGPSD